MSSTAEQQAIALRSETIEEGLNAFQVAGVSTEAEDLAREARVAVRDIIAVGSQLEKDLADLNERSDLIPKSGLERLGEEARTEANRLLTDANGRVDRAVRELDVQLVSAAQPTLAGSDRELLARDSLRTAIGDADGATFKQRVLGLAAHGADPEAIAVISSPWFRSLAMSRQVNGIDEFTSSIRSIAAGRAAELGSGDKQVKASQARESLKGLGLARASAMANVRRHF